MMCWKDLGVREEEIEELGIVYLVKCLPFNYGHWVWSPEPTFKKLGMVVSTFHPSTEKIECVAPSNMLSTQLCLLMSYKGKSKAAGCWEVTLIYWPLISTHTRVYLHVRTLSFYTHKRRKPELHGKRAQNREYHHPTLVLIPTKHYRPDDIIEKLKVMELA